MNTIPLALAHNGRTARVLAVADKDGRVMVRAGRDLPVPKKKEVLLMVPPGRYRWTGLCKLQAQVDDAGNVDKAACGRIEQRLQNLAAAMRYAEEQHAARTYAEQQEEQMLYRTYGRKFFVSSTTEKE